MWGTWFLFLYLITKDQFTDPRAHMVALGKQFKHGGGMDPTLLQSLYLGDGELLKLKIGPQSEDNPLSFSIDEWETHSSVMMEHLKAIPAGAYVIGFPCHNVAFVKIDDSLGFYFDPNKGIIEIQGCEVEKKLYERMNLSLKATGISSSIPSIVSIQPVVLCET